jgi:hypothetical protein
VKQEERITAARTAKMASPPYSPASSWAGKPNIVMAPPAPPTVPPPAATIAFDFVGVLITLCGAVAVAVGFLILQWWCCTFALPQREAARHRRQVIADARRAAEQAEEEAKLEMHQQELMQEVAPAPRVRMVAWTGKDIAGAVTAAPPAAAPLRYPQKKKKKKVHPAPAADEDADGDGLDYERIGGKRSVLGLWASPFVVSQCMLGSSIGFGIVYGFFSLLLTQDYYLMTVRKEGSLLDPPLTLLLAVVSQSVLSLGKGVSPHVSSPLLFRIPLSDPSLSHSDLSARFPSPARRTGWCSPWSCSRPRSRR